MKKIGFIGAGNMAGAILEAVIKANIFEKENISVFDISQTVKERCQALGIKPAQSNAELCNESDYILLGIKPNILAAVAAEIKPYISGKTVISIAAGWTVQKLKAALGTECKILRVMPNMPALAGEGMTVLSAQTDLDETEMALVRKIFEGVGRVAVLDEKHMDTVTALTGSGPAMIFMLIDALSDAAVLRGIPKPLATELAAQMVKGSAATVLESGEAASVLKDRVCSPGGTTIESVCSLRDDGFEAAVVRAVNAAAEKSERMSR